MLKQHNTSVGPDSQDAKHFKLLQHCADNLKVAAESLKENKDKSKVEAQVVSSENLEAQNTS